MIPVAVRFWAKVDKSGDCWLWTAGRNAKGYGTINAFGKRSHLAHRVSWILSFGAIPEGLHVLHKCDTPGCVNPKHLFVGTHDDNMRDRGEKGRTWSPLWAVNKAKTHCPKGHEYTPENTYRPPLKPGSRTCKACSKASVIASQKRNPEGSRRRAARYRAKQRQLQMSHE